MIKVADINKTTNLKGTGKTAKSSGGESFSAYLNETFQAKSSQINPSMALSMTEAILAAQVTDDEMEKEVRRKLVKRGNVLLEKLEEIRDALLCGYIDKDELIEISRMVKEKQLDITDEKLKEIMAEIELRVEVELAKLTR